MANQLWSQDSFAKGELSPYMYARSGVQQYYNGLKTAQNVIGYPTGAAGKRFGTFYRSNLTGFTAYDQVFFQTFHYLNECTYQLLFKPGSIDIFLEGLLIANVTPTGFDATDCYNLDYTVLQNVFRVSVQGVRPKDLKRSTSAGNVVTGFNSTDKTLTVTTAITTGIVLPVRFTTTTTLPITTPQIKVGVTYFTRNVTANTVKLYNSSLEASTDTNAYAITSAGTGTVTMLPLNTWTFANATFKNVPIYDFDGGYDAITFTPAAISGASVVITMSGALTAPAAMTSKYIGGAYIGGGGVGRIIAVTDATHFTVAVQEPFDNTAAIAGTLSLLAEPAWSDARGWPLKCSSYQNRSVFCNTDSLPNGFWASAINDYSDFNDIQDDDDDAISWYPTSDEINYIRFIVPYRSITVHTNSGVYSSPLSFETAITPKNFSLQLQDSTPAEQLQPRAIDNQIIVISGNDAHSLVWNGLDNAYTSSIVSITNEQLIRDPVDEAPYVDLRRAGSRYIFIINLEGSMSIFQTLITEDIAGWTPAVLEQSYGSASFLQVATDFNGRGWFLTQREIPAAGSTATVSSMASSTVLNMSGSLLALDSYGLVRFSTAGTMPTAIPTISANEWYWARGVGTNQLSFYSSQEDAEDNTDQIIFSNAGTSVTVTLWPLVTNFMIEELSFATFVDCAAVYSGAPTDTVTGLARFNGLDLKMVGDGFGFEGTAVDGNVEFNAHGSSVEISDAVIGFPVRLVIEPMPLTMALGRNMNYLTRPKHIRNVNFMFNNTIGGTINGIPIAINNFADANIGEPPVPTRGIFEMSIMEAWDDFNNPTFIIEHDDPFNIELLGIFYDVDI